MGFAWNTHGVGWDRAGKQLSELSTIQKQVAPSICCCNQPKGKQGTTDMTRKSLFTSTLIGVLAITGCMSLDERLASNDPLIRNEAEHELIQENREHGDEAARVAAVKRIADKDFLYEIAINAEKAYRTPKGKKINTIPEGIVAVERLGLDPSKESDEKMITALVLKSKSPEVQMAAFETIKSPDMAQDLVSYLAGATTNPKVRSAAFANVRTEKNLVALATSVSDANMRMEAFSKLKEQKNIDDVIFKTTDKTILMAGMSKVSDKSVLASHIFKEFMADKEVTTKFITDFANDAILTKIIEEHSEGLTPELCLAIKTKSQNAEIQKRITEIADKKIVESIMNMKSCEAFPLFGQISSLEQRQDFLTKRFFKKANMKLNLSDVNDSDFKKLMPLLHINEIGMFIDQCDSDSTSTVISLIPSNRVLNVFSLYVNKGAGDEPFFGVVQSSNVSPLKNHDYESEYAKYKYNESHYTAVRRMLFCRLDKSDDLNKALDIIPDTLDYSSFNTLTDKIICGDKINVSGHLEKCLSKFKIKGINEESENNHVRYLIKEKIANNLNADTKKKLCATARQKAEKQKGKTVVFGPFYPNMSYLDAILLQEEIWGSGKGVTIYGTYQKEGTHAVGDFASVWKITFDNRAKFKFMDCEDSAVLSQFIHQFIKNGTGKVGNFRYADEIKREFGEDDDRLYESYSNTKYGIKVQYCPKDGVLNMIEL